MKQSLTKPQDQQIYAFMRHQHALNHQHNVNTPSEAPGHDHHAAGAGI